MNFKSSDIPDDSKFIEWVMIKGNWLLRVGAFMIHKFQGSEKSIFYSSDGCMENTNLISTTKNARSSSLGMGNDHHRNSTINAAIDYTISRVRGCLSLG
jgi:hypothetical protein